MLCFQESHDILCLLLKHWRRFYVRLFPIPHGGRRFSRTDVVNYIEETSAAHQKALRKLEDEKQAFADENDHLLAENTRLQAELSDLRAEHEKLKEEDSALSAQVVSLSDEASELAAQLETAKQELEQLKLEQAALDAASEEDAEEDPADEDTAQPEAAAPGRSQPAGACRLRRAEQAERNAMVRARKLREQLSLLCEQSKDRYTDAGEEIPRSPLTCPPAFPVCRRRLPTFRPSLTTRKTRSTSSSSRTMMKSDLYHKRFQPSRFCVTAVL